MRTYAVATLLVALSACVVAKPSILKWKPDDGMLAVSVPLGGLQEPTDWQRDQTAAVAKDKCGADYSIIEEGADISSTPYFSMIGNVASAGTATSKSYYWIVRCRAASAKASAVTGCAKDTDCKGDRICQKGECVSPAP